MKFVAAIVLAVAVFGCTYQSSETYRASQTGQKFRVEYAIVQSSREVTVTEDSDVEKNWYGPVAAATIAGVGADVAGAQESIVLGAAVVGLGLGYLIEEAAVTRKGHEYVLRDSETGEEYALVVSVKDGAELLPPGTPVRIIGSGSQLRIEQEAY
jgi:outer membrane lipoprotein SlyB